MYPSQHNLILQSIYLIRETLVKYHTDFLVIILTERTVGNMTDIKESLAKSETEIKCCIFIPQSIGVLLSFMSYGSSRQV